MGLIARDERSWTLRSCPMCGAATIDPDDYVCTCVCALEAVEVVPASQLRGAVEALQRAEEDRDALRSEVELCHAALIDAGQRLDRRGGQ